MNRKERILLLLLAAINFTHILDFMIMMPLGNFLMPRFTIEASAFAAVVSSYNYAAFVSSILAAFVVDRFDRKKVLVFGYAGFLLGTLLCALSPTYWLLLGARIVAGLFGGLIGAQVLSIVADVIPYERRGRAMGWLISAFSVASVVGVPLGLYLARFISWHAPFYLIVIIGLIVLVAVIQYVPSVTSHLVPGAMRVDAKTTLFNIFSVPKQRAALLLSGGIMMGHFLIIPFINPYLQFNKGFLPTLTPMVYIIGGATTIVGGLIWGRLSDTYGKLRIFTISGLLSLIPIFFITNLPAWPFSVVLIPFAFWFGMANGRTIALQAMVTQVVSAEHRGSFMSFLSSVQQLFTGIAGTVAGAIVVSDAAHKIYNYHYLGYLSMAVIAICLLLAGRLGVK